MTYQDDPNGQDRDVNERNAEQPSMEDGAPTPPTRWNGENAPIEQNTNIRSDENRMFENPRQNAQMGGMMPARLEGKDAFEFLSARKYLMASQIMAVVSLIIGGVLLSSIAVITAIIGWRKMAAVANRQTDVNLEHALKRPAYAAIIVSSLSLALNAITLALFYPILMNALETGDVSSLWTFGNTSSSGTTGGNPIFG